MRTQREAPVSAQKEAPVSAQKEARMSGAGPHPLHLRVTATAGALHYSRAR
jgi:hypothetical protein